MEIRIPFNRPFLTGNETRYVRAAVCSGHTAGNGGFTRRCQQFFESRYGFKKALLASSCTDALEMAAILTNVGPGDEVVMPSYTFVSTANAFVLRGADVRFADTEATHPNISVEALRRALTERTKAIVVVHYAGVACDMDEIQSIAKERGIFLIEDAAHSIESFYRGRPLGSFGDLSTFSFHETKNIISGEGGMLVVNNEQLLERAEIIWQKGTNRMSFERGEASKYSWVDIGSSFLPSDITAAFLFAQIENLEPIQEVRVGLWHRYHDALHSLERRGSLALPSIREGATINGHLYYVVCRDLVQRDAFITHLRQCGIHAVFHYVPLHSSPFYRERSCNSALPNTDRFANCLVRLPLFYELTADEQDYVIDSIRDFFSRV